MTPVQALALLDVFNGQVPGNHIDPDMTPAPYNQRQPGRNQAAPAETSIWILTRFEWACVSAACGIIIGFGVILECRTALRRVPMTDLGVYTCAGDTVRKGGNIYHITDWHGWHYQYPPPVAILFAPLATPGPDLRNGAAHPASGWGYPLSKAPKFYGLHHDNLKFFCVVAFWYALSVALVFFSVHLLACALEQVRWKSPPPSDIPDRKRWWGIRALPILICLTSIGTELSRGQADVLMLFAVSAAVYGASAERDFVAGAWLSVPAAIKLFPPIILIWPVWQRRWKMAAGVLAGGILVFLLFPAVALGPKRTTELYGTWMEVLVKPSLGMGTDKSRAGELTNINATDNQSLLALIHNRLHHDKPRRERPLEASHSSRNATYISGLLMLSALAWLAGARPRRSPRDLLVFPGLLIGVAFVVSPTVHHFYYIMLLPLIVALVSSALAKSASTRVRAAVAVTLGFFMLIDIAARFPGIGGVLRDQGLPLLTLLALMAATGVLELAARHALLEAGPAG